MVYGRPALAAPVIHLLAQAAIEETGGPEIALIALDIGRSTNLSNAYPGNPLAAAVQIVANHLGGSLPTGFSLSVTSAIPIAAGLGSGAAIAVAVIRALSDYLGAGH